MARNIEIDIVKGLGIFSVVVGHIVPGITAKIIFLFHMPLFFIVSGHLHSFSSNKFKYFARKSISLLLPYFTYLFVLHLYQNWSLLSQIFHYPSTSTIVAFIKHIFWMLWGGRLLQGTLGVFWFVTCLFLTQQLYNYAWNRLKSKMQLLFLAAILYVFSVTNQYILEWYPFPWGFNIVLCSFLFYTIGNIYGEFIFGHHDIKMNILSMVISVIAIILILFDYKLSFNMKNTYYGWFLVSPLAAVLMTKNLSFLSYKISCCAYLRGLLIFAGKASITIMFMHQFLHVIFKGYCIIFPVFMSVFIFIICLLLHYLTSLNNISRILFLGSRDDLKNLITKFTANTKVISLS